jgi:hypothetical protein
MSLLDAFCSLRAANVSRDAENVVSWHAALGQQKRQQTLEIKPTQ